MERAMLASVSLINDAKSDAALQEHRQQTETQRRGRDQTQQQQTASAAAQQRTARRASQMIQLSGMCTYEPRAIALSVFPLCASCRSAAPPVALLCSVLLCSAAAAAVTFSRWVGKRDAGATHKEGQRSTRHSQHNTQRTPQPIGARVHMRISDFMKSENFEVIQGHKHA
jgi:hypothetical protein